MKTKNVKDAVDAAGVVRFLRTDDQGDLVLIVDERDFYYVRKGRGSERCHLCPFYGEEACRSSFVEALGGEEFLDCGRRRLVYWNPGRMRGYLLDKAKEEGER